MLQRQRRRKAALTVGAVLPHELVAQLAESGQLVGEGDDLHLAGVAEGGDGNAGPRPGSAHAAPAAVPPQEEAAPAAKPASAEGEEPSASGSTDAQHASNAVSTVLPAGDVEHLPAYTSLARKQLHSRLKAAIAAGTRSGSAGPPGAQPRHNPPHTDARKPAAARPTASPLPPPAMADSRQPPNAAEAQLPPLAWGTHAASCQPPASCEDAGLEARGEGFELPLPRTESPMQQACTAAGGTQPLLQSNPVGGGAAHWLAGQLQQHQQLYHPAPRPQHDPAPRHRRQQQQQQQQGVHRGLLALLLPPLTARFAGLMPARVADASGQPCLLVLPSDGPSNRREAEDATAALQQLLADPAAAAQRAAAWREQLLLGSSSAALLGLTAEYVPPQQHEQQLRKAPASQGAPPLLSGPSWLASSIGRAESPLMGCHSRIPCFGHHACEGSTGSSSRAAQDVGTGLRSSSSFLRSGSRAGAHRSASPLPPLAPSCAASRLSAAPSALGAGWEENARLLGNGSQHSNAVAPVAQPLVLATDPAWDSYCFASLAAGIAACMAEAVRQVEVACAERGRLLCGIWNNYNNVLTAMVRQQQQQLEELAAANANLSAEASQLRWECSTAGFLRTEIGRLRKDKETVALELDDSRQEVEALRVAAETAQEEQLQLENHLRQRLATLRWKFAGKAVLLPEWRTWPVHTGGAGLEPGSCMLLQHVACLERLTVATAEVQRRLREWHERRRAEAALSTVLAASPLSTPTAGHPRPHSRLQHASNAASPSSLNATHLRSMHRAPFPPAALSSSSGFGAPNSQLHMPALLGRLQPEARSALLLSQPPQERQLLLAGMSDAERASMLVLLTESVRLQLMQEMGPALAVSTDSLIARKPLLLSRLLATLPADQAALHFAARTAQQQVAVLQVAPPQQSAPLLLAQQPEAQRHRLLRNLAPAPAAGLLEWVQPGAALELLLGAATVSAAALPEGAASGGDSSSWVAGLLDHLSDRHLRAMLASTEANDVASLLLLLSQRAVQRLLQMLSPSQRAASLAVAHQRQVVAARQKAAEEEVAAVGAAVAATAVPGAATAADVPVKLFTAGQVPAISSPSAPAVPEMAQQPLQLPPPSAALAHFQQLSAAEKTSVLLMGSATSAALLLPLLGDGEMGDVMMLLPPQRQELLLQALHPDEEARLRAALREAALCQGSLLLPQQLACAAHPAMVVGEAGSTSTSRSSSGTEPPRERRESSRQRRTSSVFLGQASRRPSMASVQDLGQAVTPLSDVGGVRRSFSRQRRASSLLGPASHRSLVAVVQGAGTAASLATDPGDERQDGSRVRRLSSSTLTQASQRPSVAQLSSTKRPSTVVAQTDVSEVLA